MKIMIQLTLLTLTLPLFSQVVDVDPIVDVGQEWGNHQIESFHFTQHGGFAFIDDGSIWLINDEDHEWIKEENEELSLTAITLMPEAGTEKFPCRIIVHHEGNSGWKDFTVNQLSAPFQNEATHISDIDLETGHTLTLGVTIKEGTLEVPLVINPLYAPIVKRWKKGQKVIIGGVWFPEYDPNEHKDYCCAYLYVLYNYETAEYAFFAV